MTGVEEPAQLRIGELARSLGVRKDTIRFYEKSGWLPRPTRGANGYRRYSPNDVEHLRLLVDLRRMELPLEEAARVASWCHSGHCASTTESLPHLIAAQREEIRARVAGLAKLDRRLADLERHLAEGRSAELPVLHSATACCDAAAAVTDTMAGTCACCAVPVAAGRGA